MQGTHGKLHVLVLNYQAHLDFGGTDHFDVDAFSSQRLKHTAGNACVSAHTDANHTDFSDINVGMDALGMADRDDFFVEHL